MTHATIVINVRPVRSGPTRHPFHTFNQQISMHASNTIMNVAVYSENKMAHEVNKIKYGLTLYRTALTASSKVNCTRKNS